MKINILWYRLRIKKYYKSSLERNFDALFLFKF